VDDTRFDLLAKRFAGKRSRRSLLGIAAAVAGAFAGRGQLASATPQSVPLGGVCYRDRQCINDYAPPRGAGLNPDFQVVYCADNGFSYDGDLNCCRTGGGACGRDEECCDTAFCDDGFCSWGPRFAGSGDPCDANTVCSAADASLTCAYNPDTGDHRCCAGEGGRCFWDGGCCGYLRCTDAGFCASAPRSGCPAYLCPCDPSFNQCEPGLGCCPSESGHVCAPWCYGG
jgi:hypothetical protein